MKRIIYTLSLAVLSLLTYTSCDDDDDGTGDSALKPTSPTVSFSGVPDNQTFVEFDTTFIFTVLLSEAQVVDVPLYISQAGGTASEGSDYVINNINSRVLIPAGRTSGTVSISILPDGVFEEDEELVIQVGDARSENVSLTPATITFGITNLTESDFHLDLSWSTADVFLADGSIVEPADLTDIDFYVYDATGASAAASETLDFESIVLDATLADGSYTIVAALWDNNTELNPGALYPMANLSFSYDQLGVQSGTWDYASAIDLNLVCSVNQYEVATLTKTGTNWTISNSGVSLLPNPMLEEGTYTATADGAGDVAWYGGAVTKTVTITAQDDGTYLISDVSAGGYALCCLGFGYNADQPAVIAVNGCLQAEVVGDAGSQIESGQSTYGLGSYNEDTQTLTIKFSDEFNDSDGSGFDLTSVFVKD